MHSYHLAHVNKTMQYCKYCDGIPAISAVSCGESGTTNWIPFPYTNCWQSMGECKSSCCFGWRFMDIYGFYGHFHLSWKQLNSPWSSTMYICPLWSNTCRTWLPEKTFKKVFQESIEKDAQEHFGSTYLEKSMCLGNGMSSSMRQGVFFGRDFTGKHYTAQFGVC